MEFLIAIISLLVAVASGLLLDRYVEVADQHAAARIAQAEKPAARASTRVEEQLGAWLTRLVPGYVRQVRSDLYWAAFADSRFQGRSAAAVFGRQLSVTAAVGLAAYLVLASPIALAGGLFIGWSLARSDLHSRAEAVRGRISQELPEFVQLMAAESASGAGLEIILRRAAGGTSMVARWLFGVLDASAGKPLFSKDGKGTLRSAAETSGHPALVSLAIQLGFAGGGIQVQSLLKSLAQTFADEFIAQAETRAEKLGSSLGVMAAVFYFMPFVITVLVIVGVPLISTIAGS